MNGAARRFGAAGVVAGSVARAMAGLAVIALGGLGCTRADVYPITGPAGGDAGPIQDGGAGDGASTACPAAALAPGDSTRMVAVGTQMRSYLLHVPPAYDGSRAVPLVVDFHAIGESGADERASSPYPAVLDREGVLMAFPNGLRGSAGTAWNFGPCCVAGVDDVAFARALVAAVQSVACIDRTRVYAVGTLTGAGMVHHLACHAADTFAAVAPAALDLLEENVDDCQPSRPITVISFRGTAATRVPYAGGPSSLVPGMPVTFLGAQGTFETWARINGCTGAPSAPDANGCSRYGACRNAVEVILCTQQQGTDDTPPAAGVAWPVLMRHTL